MTCTRGPRRGALGAAVSVLCALVAPACLPGADGGDAGSSDDAGASGPAWQEAFDASDRGSLASVWGSGPDDVFVVGGGQSGGTITHYDGSSWAPMEVPLVPFLTWVYGFAPDDVFAVGLQGAALRYDGAAWTTLTTPTPLDLWGVFGFTNDDVWMVGGNAFDGEPVLLHFDGEGFTQVELPESENPDGARALFKVWGKSGRLFAVGQLGLILELVDGEWRRQPAGELANDDFISLWGVSDERIVAVGGRSNARIATFDGTSWTTTAPDGMRGLNAVFMEAPGHALVAGLEGTAAAFHLDDASVTYEDTGVPFELHGLWGDGAGRTYAVGGTFFAPHRGVALVRTSAP